MYTYASVKTELEDAFDSKQAQVLARVITDAYSALVKTSDFNELKEIVKELAETQGRTELKVEALAEAQGRTELKMEELAEAQRQTEKTVNRLGLAVEKLTDGLVGLRQEVGSLGNRFGFDLEDFAGALLPPYLERHQHITGLILENRYFQISDDELEEVDLVGTGQRDGCSVLVLIECRTSIKGGAARKLAQKLKRVQAVLGDVETMLGIVAMNIHPTARKVGEKEGVLLIPYSHINRPWDFEQA